MVDARLRRMLEARSVAVVGASDRPDSFGWRLTTEALRSPGYERVHLVNPTRPTVADRPCLPSLAAVPEPVDLVLLGVPDHALVDQVRTASARGDGGAVVFGPANGVRDALAEAADGLAICGGGCMGFVHPGAGVRAIGYLERDPLTPGPVALVTHSGSVFSAMLRTHRRLDYSLAVSSGQELVTEASRYVDYALSLPETRVVGLVLETLRDAEGMRAALATAADHDVPVVALTVGTSTRGQDLVGAHSGALAGSDAAWEALFAAYGVHRVDDLGELTDSLELFAVGRRVRGRHGGIATVHDSGAERVLVADVAERLGVPFAPLTTPTVEKLGRLLEPGLAATNPLDVWGTGSGAESILTGCLLALADDEQVDVVALAVDLVEEYDGDEAFPRALHRLAGHTGKPVVVLSNLSAAIDQELAADLRSRGIPVLEGTRSGLRALGHLLDQAAPPVRADPQVDEDRQARWARRLASGAPVDPLALAADYGVDVVSSRVVTDVDGAVAAAGELGYPVVLKTGAAEVLHKVDVDGVRLDLRDEDAVAAAYADLAARLGEVVEVQRQVPAGVEVALGVHQDPLVGPLLVVASGGTLVELLRQRAVALPPVSHDEAGALVVSLPLSALLDGHRGGPPLARDALTRAVVGVAQLALELGDHLTGLDLNPLVVGPDGAIAVDGLVVR
ncbi:acetate--CoA ligase family protein [Nocardioides taihuensis]|uniref:Acetate--CoA ligase family protein n=1 Tax=Nocardioides taihuensis TaxID=1835606 RepID=A0ABW0BHL0_9ACTN